MTAPDPVTPPTEDECCDLHGRNCEPLSELCCSDCTEANHPLHQDGSTCSNPDLSGNAPTEDRAGEVAALSAALHEHIDGDFLVGAGLRIGNVGEDVPHWDATVKELVAWAARACAPVVASIVAARVEEARAEDQATIARVEALAADNGVWKGEKHVRVTRRDSRLGADVTESYVKVSDLRAALASPDTTGCPDCATGGIDHNHCTACGVSVRWGARCDDHPMPASSGAVTQADTTGEATS